MINFIVYLLKRRDEHYDPVPRAYALSYADAIYAGALDHSAVDALERALGGLQGKTVLDLGAGPGHLSLEMARRDAKVTWHDISGTYLEIARRHAQEHRLDINFTRGFMEDATGAFDGVLVSQCWNYCLNDAAFARKLFSLLKPGGIAYATINNEIFFRGKNVHFRTLKRYARLLQFLLNRFLNVKIGHPFPSHGKIKRVSSVLQKRLHPQACTVERSGHYTLLTIQK